MEAFGGLDIIVNTAGYTWDATIQKMTDEQFQAMLDVHLVAPFRILRAAAEPIRIMAKKEAEAGREVFRKVVNISSIAGLYGNAGQASYSSAKASLVGLTRTMCKEWGRYKVNVNCIAFGLINTRLTQPIEAQQKTIDVAGRDIKVGVQPQMLDTMSRMIPLDVAARLRRRTLSICSKARNPNYISGQVVAAAAVCSFNIWREVSMEYRSSWMTEELDAFRSQFRKFLAKDLAPHAEKWRHQKMVDRSAWRALGGMRALFTSVPETYGGLGATFAYDAAVIEDIESVVPEALGGVSVSSGIVAHYILNYGSDEQKRRWLPGMARGELIGAIAMTEPGTGSDLQSVRTTARRQGNSYVINGQKTFITNGQTADLIIVVARTGGPGAKCLSLIVVETEGNDGFRRGRNLDKIGLHASDTSELFFEDVVAPSENLLGGEEGQGFVQLMQQLQQERLIIAVGAVASMERAVKLTVDYTKERKAFGQPIIEFQNTAFTLAERKTEAMIARVFVDWCIERLIAGDLDAVTASMAKWWCAQKQVETADECLQLHGGYGYMQEYPISRMFVDARIQKIYGGTNEVMKLLIARSL
jgi:acyl-CoA dehydrogenase